MCRCVSGCMHVTERCERERMESMGDGLNIILTLGGGWLVCELHGAYCICVCMVDSLRNRDDGV